MPTENSPPLSSATALPTDKLPSGGSSSSRSASSYGMKWIIVLLPLAYLWFRLIDNLRNEWTTNPQYGYGWLVPLLCLGLIVRKWTSRTESGSPVSQIQSPKRVLIPLFTFLGFLYLPTRLIEAATPEWRPIQWLLGIEAIGLTLCAIGLGKGRGWLGRLAFPVAFFFVAIPWPTLVEFPIIQTLTRVSAAIVIELLGWIGVPAIAHGNVIEVSSGVVGINEACSGIRSFQSSLMISLFLGEFYGLNRWRRLLLIPIGFVLSLAFNVCRMSVLTVIAAKKGVAAISQYHDQAGITITILCTLGLWGVASLLRSPKPKAHSPKSNEMEGPLGKAERETFDTSPCIPLPDRGREEVGGSQKPEVRSQESVVATANFQHSTLNPPVLRSSIAEGGEGGQLSTKTLPRLAFALIAWLVVVEAGVQLWYRNLESRIKPGAEWSLNFPMDNPTLKNLPIDADTRSLLRFDEGKQAAWQESDGTQWQAFYFNWLPGRVAGYLAKRHTPEICLTATGRTMLSGPELTMVKVHGVELPIRSYVFETGGEVIHVFHCRWEVGMETGAYVEQESARFNLVRGIWAGRGNKGQKVLEFVVFGMDDSEQAKQALVGQLDKLIKVQKSKAAS